MPMLTERRLWLAATTVAIGILVLMIFQMRLERHETTRPRFDQPSIVIDPDDRQRLFSPPNSVWS